MTNWARKLATRGRGRGALLALTALLLLPLAACGGSNSKPSLTVGLTYVPNIQFAPFYVAQAKGFYKDAGLDVKLQHHAAGADEFGALVAGQEDILFGGGDEVLQARSKDNGPALVYVAQVFNQYPVALIVPDGSPIKTVADLKGHSVGIPGQYGATWIGLLALLKDAGLNQSDVNIQSIGFTQIAALSTGQVDSVMGYVNNEPVQFQQAGVAIRTFPVSDPLVSNGLAALRSELDKHPDDIKKFVAATLKGVQYTIDHPDEAFELSKQFVPDLQDSQKDVLTASIALWKPQGSQPLGFSDPAAWQAMASFLQEQGLLASQPDVSKVYDASFLPK
jgi:NitT/TauT family transport system substrate-binding protein